MPDIAMILPISLEGIHICMKAHLTNANSGLKAIVYELIFRDIMKVCFLQFM